MEETTNPTFKLLHVPTVTEEEAKYGTQKFEFGEEFDQTVFGSRVMRKVI